MALLRITESRLCFLDQQSQVTTATSLLGDRKVFDNDKTSTLSIVMRLHAHNQKPEQQIHSSQVIESKVEVLSR